MAGWVKTIQIHQLTNRRSETLRDFVQDIAAANFLVTRRRDWVAEKGCRIIRTPRRLWLAFILFGFV
jgi:hypothetical protein